MTWAYFIGSALGGMLLSLIISARYRRQIKHLTTLHKMHTELLKADFKTSLERRYNDGYQAGYNTARLNFRGR